MKVLLIKPPIEGLAKLTKWSRQIPVGLMYLTHVLRQHGFDVKIFDSLLYKEDTHVVSFKMLSEINKKKIRTNPFFKNIIHFGAMWNRIQNVIRELQPNLIGITSIFSPYYLQAYFTAEMARQVCPSAKILMGGSHTTVMWQDVFAQSPVDGVVLGEGEGTLTKLLLDLKSSDLSDLPLIDVSHYPGLIVRRPNGKIAVNEFQEFISDLDSLGFPTLDDMEFSRYGGIASIITSRGCPFSCKFCSVHSIMGKELRSRSPENVLEELRYYVKHCVFKFNIEDDNFTFDIHRADRIMEAICSSDLKIELRFPNGITALKMTKERLRLFARAGVRELFFGLESTDAVTRNNMNKSFANLDDIIELIHMARVVGISAYASIITGLPDQTPGQLVEDLVEVFFRDLRASANPYYPIPGTELFNKAVKNHLLTESDLEWYEPLNFAFKGISFDPSDVANTYIMSIALTKLEYIRFHRRFLQSQQPPASKEVLKALEELHVLVSGSNVNDIILSPRVCFCEKQHLIKRHLSDSFEIPVVNPCAFSGIFLQMIMQLWTRKSYEYKEIQCCVTEPVERCIFRLRSVSRPLERVVQFFLTRLQYKFQNIPLQKMSAENI